MSQPVTTYGVAIVGDNKVEKGAKAAEKRLGLIPKHVGVAGDRIARDGERRLGASTRGLLRTFGEVKRAGAKIFGGRSITSGMASRLGGITEAASAAGTGLGEAAASGGMLSTALGVVGVAASATVGILAAAGYAAFKLADGWAQGAASIGRTAETIGVSTKALQEFSAAAERSGVDKDKAVGSLGGLSQTLNDAAYGRNSAALAVLGRLGVALKRNDDGTVDIGAMLPALSDAIARQNSSGRRTVARGLGIDLAALPAFTGGGKQMASDMADADTHAVVLTGGEIDRAKRIVRKGAMVGQLKDRVMSAAGSATDDVAERGYDAVLSGGQALLDGTASVAGVLRGALSPAASTIGRAADKIEGAGEKLLLGARAFFEGRGWSRNQASGIVAGLNRESRLRANAVGDRGHAFGIGQWHEDRQANFQRLFGHSIRSSSREEQLAFVDWELRNTEGRAGRRLRAAGGAYDAGAAVSRFYERPADRDGEARLRGAAAEHLASLAAIPVKVEIDARGLPAGTRTRVTAGQGSHPAVSHAFH